MYNGHDGVLNHQPYCTMVYSTVYSGADQRKHQRSASLAFVRGFRWWPGNSPHKRTRNAENVSIWWRHHIRPLYLRTGGTKHPYPTTEYPQGTQETQAMSIYLWDLYYMKLPYIGSWPVSADIFGWTYLYLYLNRCICICIWIKVEENICICIWKIQIFVFVFVFDKRYLTPALIFINENVWTSQNISLKFAPEFQINNVPALIQIMAWRRPGDKPLFEPMMVSLLTHICVTLPQWVN